MDNKNHNIPEHDSESETKKDHYHDGHHFDSKGNHDDVEDIDFHWKSSLFTSKRNMTFKITLTGVFLALAIAISALEMLYEPVLEAINLKGVTIPFRILDIVVITLSLAALGPIFSSVIAFIVPYIHLLDGHHNPLTVVIDSLGYFVSIWVIWFIYYFVFRNSNIHRYSDKKVDTFKRWIPMAIYVPAMAFVYTLLVFAMIYITTSEGHDEETTTAALTGIATFHDDHDHSHGEWSSVTDNLGVFIGVISAVEIVRFSICYSLFAVIEPQVKKINHYYR